MDGWFYGEEEEEEEGLESLGCEAHHARYRYQARYDTDGSE